MTVRGILFMCLLAVLCACGDDSTSLDAGETRADGGVDAATDSAPDAVASDAGAAPDSATEPDASVDSGGVADELKAFPSAYGAGAYSTGGRGGHVYHVTSLLDDGAEGTLRWALGQPRPATVVFDVSGIIDIQDWLNVSGDNLTIAGQTAPEGGITITSNAKRRIRGYQDATNHVIRYLRIRMPQWGDDAYEYFSDGREMSDLIMDHISISYGGDESLSVRGGNTHNITYQNILIVESKTGSLFGDSGAANSYDMSFLSSLFFNVSHRHPNSASDGHIEIINNVVHQWQYRMGVMLFDIQLNHINNFYSMGLKTLLETRSGLRMVNQADPERDQAIYTAGNIVDKGFLEDPNADNRPVLWVERFGGPVAPARLFVDEMHPLLGAPVPIRTAYDVIDEIRNNPDVGANASLNADGSVTYYTDLQDTFYLETMARGEGAGHPYVMQNKERSWTLESMYQDFFRVTDIGDPLDYGDDEYEGVPYTLINTRPDDYDTDGDGMPNVWERLRGTNPDVADNNEDDDGDGYTNLEEFLNAVDYD
ncbi:MAG: hypothetical protein AB8H86_09705 [Polyangiales bacterium]